MARSGPLSHAAEDGDERGALLRLCRTREESPRHIWPAGTIPGILYAKRRRSASAQFHALECSSDPALRKFSGPLWFQLWPDGHAAFQNYPVEVELDEHHRHWEIRNPFAHAMRGHERRRKPA